MRIRSSFGKAARAVVASVASAALAVALVPAAALAQPTPVSTPAPTAEQIKSMLEGRDYVEGEAIVVAEKGADLNGGQAETLA